MKDLISIIIPVYKVEQVLRRCLDSIIAQTYTNFEAIIIDDGSPDNCGAICEEYAERDNRFRVFHKTNGGLPSARNQGLDKMSSHSKYVCFIDSDDYVKPTWLQDFIDNYRDEDILIQNSLWWKNDEILLERKLSFKGNEPLFERIKILATQNSLHVWNAMWKAEIIRKNSIRFPDFQYWEDVGFYFIFCKYVKNINIIPNGRLHCYNYNYFYPVSYRKYNDLNFKWFEVKLHVVNLWTDLCKEFQAETSFDSYGNGLICDLYSKLLIVIREDVLSKQEIFVLFDLISSLCANKKLPMRYWLLSIAFDLNKKIAYGILKRMLCLIK